MASDPGVVDRENGSRSREAPALFFIGCAGWSILSRHGHLFEPADSMLARYATRFNCVEINSSFYRPHQRKTYERWAQSVPDGFRFSVKLPKTITHERALIGCGADMDRFAGEVTGLGHKLGGVLVQLPPSLAFDARQASAFFGLMRRRFDTALACEARHPSWFGAAAERIWARHRVTRVAADPAPVPDAARGAGHGAWHYWRWHGSPRMYYSAYDGQSLDGVAASMRAQASPERPAWIIFDNTAHGHSTTDAAALQAKLQPA